MMSTFKKSYLQRGLCLVLSLVLISCSKEGSAPSLLNSLNIPLTSGDVIVANRGNGSIFLLNHIGEFKSVLFQASTSDEFIGGVTYNSLANEILISIDGSDRIMSVDVTTGEDRIFAATAQLNGTIRSITQLNNGDILVIETNALERFDQNGVRITTNGWPKTLQTTPSTVKSLKSGGFVLCSTGSDVVRTYDNDGVQINTASSGIAGTTDATGCTELSDGSIAVTWSGTTDTVQILSPDLSTVLATYSDISKMPLPSSIAELQNGNLVISDLTYNHLIEITKTGQFVQFLASPYMNQTQTVFVVP